MKLLLAFFFLIIVSGIAEGAYINNEAFNQGNGIYLTLNDTTFDNLTCCSLNTFFMNISGHAITWSAGANKTITNATWNADNFTFQVSGSAGWINFSSSMLNASTSYNLTASGTYVEARNTTASKVVWFNYTGDAVLSVTWNTSSPASEPPVANGLPVITSYSPADLTPTIDVNALTTFNAGANQSVQWTWTGATEGIGDGTMNSTATQTWATTGAKTVTVTCSNANGSCGIIQWDVTVVVVPTTEVVITGYTPSSQYNTVRSGNAITFQVTESSNVIDYHWMYDGVGVGDTSDTYIKTFNINTGANLHYVKVYGTNGSNTSNTVQWRISVMKLLAVAPIPTLNQSSWESMNNSISTMDMAGYIMTVVGSYTNVMGNYFYLLIWGIVFVMLWIRQGSITIPSTLGMILGAIVIAMLPEQYQMVAQVMIAMGIIAAIYVIYSERG